MDWGLLWIGVCCGSGFAVDWVCCGLGSAVDWGCCGSGSAVDWGVRRVIDDSGFDFEIVDWNKLVFAGWIDVVPYYTKKETFRLYMDVKSLKDREVSKAQGEDPEPIEAQINNILTGIIKQRERASEMKAQIIHIVSFLYVKPSQRLNAINYFYAEAEKRNVDLRGFRLMDTSMDQIIDFTKLI